MNTPGERMDRRTFAKAGLVAGTGLTLAGPAGLFAQQSGRRIKTGVIGCGSVSHSYLPVLAKSPHVELVSVCDIRPERAGKQAKAFNVPHHYLTGLLGPVRQVTAMLSIVTPERQITGKGKIKVTEEDNAMVLMDHGNGVISHVQSGFNYFNPHGHDGSGETRHTISLVGSKGYMGLVGYDWAPLGVDLATEGQRELKRSVTDPNGYVWQQGAALAAEALVKGTDLRVTPEQALHVLEIITAARESQETGRRIALKSTFNWPVVS